MILGALRSVRASSKAMGVAISPKRRSGGVSRGMVLDLEIVFFFEDGAKALAEPLLQFQNHAMSLRKMLDFHR